MNSNIEYRKLIEISDIVDSLHQTPQYRDTGIPMVRVTDVRGGNLVLTNCLLVTEDDYNKYTVNHVPKKGDIVISRVGTYGNFSYVAGDDKFCLGQNTAIICPKINSRYLYYNLISPMIKEQIERMVVGVTQKTISLKNIKALEIPVFPDYIQEKITAILLAIDNKIENNQRINDNLQQQAQVLFDQYFPYTIDDKLPAGWNVGNVGDIVDIHDSKRIPLSGPQRAKMEKRTYPYYGATSVMDFVDEYIFDGKYLLLSEDGTVADDEGYPILQYVWGQFWVNNHAHILTGRRGFTVESLLLLFKKTPITSIITGAVQLKISQAKLRSLKIVIPPKSELDAFDELIQPFFSQIRQIQEQNKRLTELRDALLPKLMSGEIDVSEVEL